MEVEMGLNIKNPDTEAAIRALAALTGEKLTVAIDSAVREKLERVQRAQGKPALTDYLISLAVLQAALADKLREKGAP